MSILSKFDLRKTFKLVSTSVKLKPSAQAAVVVAGLSKGQVEDPGDAFRHALGVAILIHEADIVSATALVQISNVIEIASYAAGQLNPFTADKPTWEAAVNDIHNNTVAYYNILLHTKNLSEAIDAIARDIANPDGVLKFTKGNRPDLSDIDTGSVKRLLIMQGFDVYGNGKDIPESLDDVKSIFSLPPGFNRLPDATPGADPQIGALTEWMNTNQLRIPNTPKNPNKAPERIGGLVPPGAPTPSAPPSASAAPPPSAHIPSSFFPDLTTGLPPAINPEAPGPAPQTPPEPAPASPEPTLEAPPPPKEDPPAPEPEPVPMPDEEEVPVTLGKTDLELAFRPIWKEPKRLGPETYTTPIGPDHVRPEYKQPIPLGPETYITPVGPAHERPEIKQPTPLGPETYITPVGPAHERPEYKKPTPLGPETIMNPGQGLEGFRIDIDRLINLRNRRRQELEQGRVDIRPVDYALPKDGKFLDFTEEGTLKRLEDMLPTHVGAAALLRLLFRNATVKETGFLSVEFNGIKIYPMTAYEVILMCAFIQNDDERRFALLTIEEYLVSQTIIEPASVSD